MAVAVSDKVEAKELIEKTQEQLDQFSQECAIVMIPMETEFQTRDRQM